MSKFTKESDIRKQVGKITAIRSKGTDDKACCYNLAKEEEADAEAEFKEKESVDGGNDDDDEVGCYTVNGIRSGFWSIRENRGRLIKAGLTRKEKEGVHLRRGESHDCDDVGLTTISETATIKDTVFREAVHQLQQQHQSRTSQQPRVACCYCCDAVHVCKDQQPVYPLTGSGIIDVPGCHHHRSSHPLSSSSSSPLTFCQIVNHNQSIFDHNLQIQLTNKTANQLSTVNLNKCSVDQSPHQTSKRYCDSRFAPHFVSSSSSSTETSKTSKTSCTSIPSCSLSFDRFVVDSDCNNNSEVKKVNKLKLTDNQLVKCSHVGSNNDTSVLFSGLVANKRKLFTRLLVKDTIKKVDSNHNKNYKLKQEAINQQPLSSGTQSSSLSLSRFNSGKVDYKERQQHQHQLGQCYKSFKMVAETDNHSINGEGMAMTINHSNREMTMFLDNINGHHYENINVYHSNSHNHSHHHPLANGKNLNPVSYLHKDRPNSANSYSLESNSSESNTTDSSGTISSPSSSTDDTHGDELQYGPGIVDKLRSKFLQYSLQTSRNNGYRSVVKRCSSLENLADRDSPSSSPLYHTCKGTNFGIRKGPNYVKYHHQQNNNNPHHCSKQSNHIKSNNSYNGVASDVDINCGGGGGAAAVVISNNNNNNRGLINGKTFQSVTSTTSTEKLLQGESRNSCFTASRTPNGYISSSGRNYRKYEQQPIKGNHYHHLNQHSSIYHNHNHRYNCDGLLKRAQSVETLLLESRNCKSGAPSTSTSITFTNSNSNNTVPNNSNLNSTLLTSTVSTVTTTTSSTSSSSNSTSNSGSEYCEPLLLPVSNQQSRWQSNNSNNNNNISLASSVVSGNNAFSNKVNCVSQVCNHHLVTKQQDLVDTVTNTCKKMSSDDNNIFNGMPLSECKVKSSIYSPLSSNTDKKMNGDVTSSVTSNNVTCAPTTAINNSNNCNNNNNVSDLVNHGPRKLVEDELPKPDTVKNYKKIFETNSVSPTPLAGPLSPSSSSSSSSSATTTTTITTTSTINTTLPTATNNDHTSSSQNEKDSESRNGQAYRKGGIYGSSNSAIRRKPPVLSSIEKKITNTVNKVTINSNSNSNSNNNNNTNHSSTRLINGSNTTSSSPTSPALPPKPPFLINKKLPLNGELNHVNVNNNNYLSAIKPVGKQHQISSESNKNKINSGKSVNGSKDNLRPTCNNISSSKSNLVRNKPLPSSLNNIKPKLINKFDEQPPTSSSPTSRSSSTSSSLSSSPLISPSSFMPPSPLSNGSKRCIEGDLTGNDTMDGCPLITSSSEFNNTLNGPFSPSLDKDDCKESDKPLISQKVISEPKPASSTPTTTSSMITTNNKPIANIKPIQLESSEDRWKPTISKKSTLPQESLASDSADKQHEKVVFTSMGVTNNNNNNKNNNTNNVIKDQSSHQDYVKTGLPSRVNDKNRLNNHDNQMSANKKMHSETDEKSKIEPSNLNNHNKDSKTTTNSPISSNESIKSRSYHSPSPPTNSTNLSSPSSSVSVVNKSSPISGTTMIFDFRGKNVKANVAVHSPPFSVVRPASSTPNSPTRSDNDNEDDYNYTGSTEVPQPSGIIFAGENVIIAGGSLLVKRNKKLTLTFNDKATATFEYPSEACYLEDPLSFSPTTSSISTTSSSIVNGHSDESNSVINQQQSTPTSSSSSSAGSSLKNNTTLGGSFSGGLASYKPTFLAAESVPFQLGVSRAIKEESDSSTSSGSSHGGKSSGADMEEEESVETSFNMIKPAEPNETTSWSTSSTALDLLF